jgi:hypothetical protein
MGDEFVVWSFDSNTNKIFCILEVFSYLQNIFWNDARKNESVEWEIQDFFSFKIAIHYIVIYYYFLIKNNLIKESLTTNQKIKSA